MGLISRNSRTVIDSIGFPSEFSTKVEVRAIRR